MATTAARECARRLGFGLGLRQIGTKVSSSLVPARQTQVVAATASSSFSSSCCTFSSSVVDRNTKGSVSSRAQPSGGLPFISRGHAVRGLATNNPGEKGAELLESLNLDVPEPYTRTGTIEKYAAPPDPNTFAVVELASRQHKVAPDDLLFIDRQENLEVNDVIECNRVLLLGSKSETIIGRPYVPNASVVAVVEVRASAAHIGRDSFVSKQNNYLTLYSCCLSLFSFGACVCFLISR